MSTELRILFRRTRRHFGLVAAVVAAAAMPIAINAALFSVVHGLWFRDLPFERPAELVAVDYRAAAGRPPELAYLPRLSSERDTLRRRLESSDLVAGASQVGFATFFDPDSRATGIEASGVDSRFFRVLGLKPALGRTFDFEDEKSPALVSRDSGVPLPVVLGYHLWQNQFGGNPDVLANVQDLGGRRVRVVGVMPSNVKFPNETNIWAPVSSERGRPPAIIRLARGATIESLTNTFPQLTFTPLRDSVRPADTRSVTLLFVAATVLMLVAWVQVAALVWSGTLGRLQEIGISLALGASRIRLLRQFWIEGAAVASVVLGIVWLTTPPITAFLVSTLPDTLRNGQYLSPGPQTFAFAAGLVVAGLVILSLLPMRLVGHSSPMLLLAGRLGGFSVRAAHVRNAFVIGQIALTTCLLYAAGLVAHSQIRAETFDHGFDTDHVLVFWPPETGTHPRTPTEVQLFLAERDRLVQASIDRLNASSVVVAAADVTAIRLIGFGPSPETITHVDGGQLHSEIPVWAAGAGPTFLQALGGTLTAGSTFADSEHAGRQDVAIVNETLAGLLSPPMNVMGVAVQKPVIGARVRTRFFQGEIIGVAKDLVDSAPGLPARPQIFIPSAHPFYGGGTITVRARAPLASSVPVIRSILQEIWGPLPPRRFGLMYDELQHALAPYRAQSTLLGLIATLCLPLAAVGLIGALLYSIRCRERETAIRIALGAEPRVVHRAVVTHALLVVGLGMIPGIAMGAALGHGAAHQLFSVRAVDPLTILGVAGGFTLLTWLVAVIPARRASQIQPARILRGI